MVFIQNVPFVRKPEDGLERCVFDGTWKLILSTHRQPELYQVHADPVEMNNLWESERSTPHVAQLVAALQEWAAATNDELTGQLLRQWPR